MKQLEQDLELQIKLRDVAEKRWKDAESLIDLLRRECKKLESAVKMMQEQNKPKPS